MVEADDLSKSSLLAWYVWFDSWIREAGLRFRAPYPSQRDFRQAASHLRMQTRRKILGDDRTPALRTDVYRIGARNLPNGVRGSRDPNSVGNLGAFAHPDSLGSVDFFGVCSRIAGWCAGSSAQVVGLFRRLQRHRTPQAILRPAPLDCKSIRVRIGPRNFDTSRMVCFK